MSGAASTTTPGAPIPEFKQVMGHPSPLWMLFMTEFWERFAFYGIRWALVLYIVAQFHGGDPSGEEPASKIYGAYLALVYAAAIFGGYVADRVLGYQRSILLGAVIMGAGLFMIAVPSEQVFKLGLATVICGNGLFKPNISTMVGKLYSVTDERRDSGFTIFYMGINLGAMIAPLVTQYLAKKVFGIESMPAYKVVFMAAGVGMILSLVWFWFGRRQLGGIGRPAEGEGGKHKVLYVFAGALASIPVAYFLLEMGANALQWFVLTPMFLILCAFLMVEAFREGAVQRDRCIAMLIIFTFNILFWMFFEQAGSSFTFLADKIVDRDIFSEGLKGTVLALSGETVFPNAWFQSVNSVAIIVLAPLIAWIWVKLGKFNPSIPRKFGLGLIFNGLAFLLLMFALSKLVSAAGLIPFWTLFAVYWIQSIGELCLSPIGLSMVTKLAPLRLVGFGMGGWFLSTGIGNNLSGIFAGSVSGEGGMNTASALSGYTMGFWILVGGGVLLFLIAPLIQRLMHGVK
ncbi:POT family proton-dependent oligopeptide transporter [Lysobacter niabensis]|uniref:POT family proton-dependent oligopeptide transporter n=1 Tax=Agrilutibacter niabensis TaxID=380628 RepID=A0ABU1VTF3_9GAMM|nr:oligopeptide:H+ symporter [Lysobacter niabensis]MDR7100776.1 POT family proton-dependent oligopeptide transporter [Lysobacter niabensis]